MSTDKMRQEVGKLTNEASIKDYDKKLVEFSGNDLDIVIYGAGKIGENCLAFINKSREVTCFLDMKADEKNEYCDLPVFHPDSPHLSERRRKNTLVVLALFLPKNEYLDIECNLRNMGYQHFVNAVYDLGVALGSKYYKAQGRRFFADDADEILTAYDLMSDNHSKEVFYSVFRSYALSDYDIQTQSIGMVQYVDVQVPFRNNFKTFVDCGAFNGDTLRSLVDYHDVKRYFGFEPDISNFEALSQTYDELSHKLGFAVLFPTGVGKSNEFLRFSSSGTSGRIDSFGSKIAQTVRMDDVLKGNDELMIKMDVEGDELSAICGAKGVITKTQPDLAICVYHHVGDLWDIPLLLHEWVPEYKFYLRNHAPYTIETVLYATVQ